MDTPPVAWNGKVAGITGATGFLGQHVLDALLSDGWKVRALVRRPQPPRLGVEWIHGSLDHPSALEALVENCDAVIHIAGLTKAINRRAFFRVNVDGTERVIDAAEKMGAKNFIQLSSLSARKPALSHYGASKEAGDILLTGRPRRMTWAVIRPPAIYGPGDHEILKIMKASRWGILPALGSRQNRFSMIYAPDLAALLVRMAHHPELSGTFEVDDGHIGGYTIADIAEAAGQNVRIITIPYPLLALMGIISGWIARLTGKPSMLTRTSARYLCHPDWCVHQDRRPPADILSQGTDLKTGMTATIEWYRKNDLL